MAEPILRPPNARVIDAGTSYFPIGPPSGLAAGHQLGGGHRHMPAGVVLQHQSSGLFLVIFLEELGIPLPAPGDVAIMYGGYLTTTGAIPYPLAYLAVVAGAVLGSACNLTISRKYGRPFIQRFGVRRRDRGEAASGRSAFQRWGPWAIIIGRHIPGMRIVLSALSGILGVPYKVFIPCVFVSSLVWAAIFLEIGRRVGPRIREVFSFSQHS